MVWRQGKGDYPGYWSSPQKVVVHENSQTIWTTVASKLFRSAPEHIRPVTASEAKQITITPNEPSISTIAQQIPSSGTQGMTRAIDLPSYTPPIAIHEPLTSPEIPRNGPSSNDSNFDQPDQEPEANANNPQAESTDPDIDHSLPFNPGIAINTLIPDDHDDDDLVCHRLWCVDNDPTVCPLDTDTAYHMEVIVNSDDIEAWKAEENPHEMLFVASAARRQRSEVKLATLSPEEKQQFQKAKEAEIQKIGSRPEPYRKFSAVKIPHTRSCDVAGSWHGHP